MKRCFKIGKAGFGLLGREEKVKPRRRCMPMGYSRAHKRGCMKKTHNTQVKGYRGGRSFVHRG